MNIKQAILNCTPKQVFITAKQGAALRAQCTDAEWAAFKSDAAKAGRGVLCVINKTRVLGSPDARTTFPGIDDA